MYKIGLCSTLFISAAILSCSSDRFSGSEASTSTHVYIDPDSATVFPGFEFQGEYSGVASLSVSDTPGKAGLQIALYGENRFVGLLHLGGLPGEHLAKEKDQVDNETGDLAGNRVGAGNRDRAGNRVTPPEIIELEGSYENHTLELKAAGSPIRIRKIHDHFTVLDEENNYLGHLNPVQRSSSTMGWAPPEGAQVLFSGNKEDLEQWDEESRMDGPYLVQGARTALKYGDIRLHLEAKIGLIPDKEPHERANSGIYLQNKYEVQIIDSFGTLPHPGSNGSLYNVSEPSFDPSFPPLSWQTWDVWFRAPRFDSQNNKTEHARATVYLNGYLLIDDLELESGTGSAASFEEVAKEIIYLQQHTGPVHFRNIWLMEEEYSPPGVPMLAPE